MLHTIKSNFVKFKNALINFNKTYFKAYSFQLENYQGKFKELDTHYRKYVFRFYFLMLFLMLFLSIGSGWLLCKSQRLFPVKSSVLYDFHASIAIWFFVGVAFMVTYLKPIQNVIVRLILGQKRAYEYAQYMYIRTLKDYDDDMYKLPSKIGLSTILLIIGFIFMSDYSVKIDEKTIRFNDFTSIFQEKVYHFNQIDDIFFEPDSTKNFSSMDLYKLQMKDGFEWTFNSSAMEIDTSVFRFLSEKSGVKIDTIVEK